MLKLFPVFAYVAVAWARDNVKNFKSLPAISSSLVNLGKMDISFHFNTKLPDFPAAASEAKSDGSNLPTNSFFFTKSEPAEEPCLCSGIKNLRSNVFNNPSELLNKILMSNDLFSNKEPTSSITCCDSHEHVQEDTVFFEFSPKQSHGEPNIIQTGALPILPSIFDTLLPNKQHIPVQGIKPKAIEIFFFPKKNDKSPFDNVLAKPAGKKASVIKKPDIVPVGGELKNEFKSYQYRPPLNIAKKDEEATDKTTTFDGEETTKTVINNQNSL